MCPETGCRSRSLGPGTVRLVGDCALAPQTHEARTVETGFTIAPEHQGRGYAREAVSLLLRYLFGQLGKHHVTASYDPRNPPSVRVLEAVGMRRNHGDWFITSGRPYVMRAALGLRRPRVAVRGRDLVGRIETVGAAVTRFRPGDDVYAETTTGSFAELACVAERRLAPKPTHLTCEQAAAVPVAAVTALQGLRDVGEVQPGQAVLINGASGGVGTFAVQIAKTLGADVTGVCSTRNVELIRSLGADHVTDYTRENITRSGQRYDLILDLAGQHPLAACRGALTRTGKLVLASGSGGPVIGPLGSYLRALALSPFVAQRLRVHAAKPSQRGPCRAHRARRRRIGHARDRGDLHACRHRRGHPPPHRATRPSQDRHRRVRPTSTSQRQVNSTVVNLLITHRLDSRHGTVASASLAAVGLLTAAHLRPPTRLTAARRTPRRVPRPLIG